MATSVRSGLPSLKSWPRRSAALQKFERSRMQRGDLGTGRPTRLSAAGEEVGGEIVKLYGLEAEGFGEEADLDLGGGVALLAEETEETTPVERGDVADDGGVLGQFGNLAGIGIGVIEIAGGIHEL